MSDLETIKPGVPLTEKQKADLAVANAKESAEAQRMAADARAHEGNQKPLQQDLADRIKGRLKDEDFTERTPENAPPRE